MRVAVTGGCGFIGSHVVDHLVAAGHEVLVLDKQPSSGAIPPPSTCIADFFDGRALEQPRSAGRDAVFHLAGAADVNDVAADPVRAVRLNVEGVGRVLDAARTQGCGRVVLASTVWVYGATVGHGERTEDAPVDLRQAGHLYVSTKLAAEMLMHSYQEMYGQEFTILRYGIPYGPRMRDALVVAKFVRAARRRRADHDRGHRRAAAQLRLRGGPRRGARARAGAGRREPDAGARRRHPGVGQRDRRDGPAPGPAAVRSQHLPAAGPPTTRASAISNRLAKELLNWSPVRRSPRASAGTWPGSTRSRAVA